MTRALTVALALWLLAHPTWATELTLPPGFTSQVYVTGHGFDRGGEGAGTGVPVMLTLGVDGTGALYMARSGNRYGSSQTEDVLSRVYRVPPGGTRLTPASEPNFAWGPPLRNPDLGAVLAPGVVFVSTFDPDRQVGVVYRVVEGRPKLFAGGTPARGEPPILVQPEGVAQDAAGQVYVADRARNVVVKLDATGRVLDPQYLKLTRARTVAVDVAGHVWAGGDGTAAQPWQDGVGQIWRVGPDGQAQMVFEGPNAAGIAAGPGGALFLTQRHTRKVIALTPDGRRLDVATLRGEAMPRGLAFAPDTPETRRAGVAGDLFVVSFVLRTWYLNEVVRITGPFAEWIRKGGVTE